MRRADRLFEIIQILRRRKLVRAVDIAQELEVSERTIYRDIADLIARRVPVRGEAGIGYMLEKGYDLPPMMLTGTEIEALVLGVRIIESWSDDELAVSASSLLSKIEAVLPPELRDSIDATPFLAPGDHGRVALEIDPALVRKAVRNGLYAEIDYRNAEGVESRRRRVRPLGMAFYGPVWLLYAWCELRDDFRSFRLDRIAKLDVGEARFPKEPGKGLRDYIRKMADTDPWPES